MPEIKVNLFRAQDFLVLFIASVTIYVVYSYIVLPLRDPVRSLPGPFFSRFTRFWLYRQVCHGDWHKVAVQVHRQYGPIVRIEPNHYSIDDPSAIKTLYGAGTSFTKGPWYATVADPDMPIHDVFTEVDIKSHAAHRRQVAALYALGSLVKMEPAVDESIQALCQRFMEFSRLGTVINLQWWIQCYAFDVIAAISLDKRFGFLDDGEDHMRLIETLHSSLKYVAHMGVFPDWHPLVFRTFKRMGKNPILTTIEFTNNQIQERLQALKAGTSKFDKGDFLSKVLELHQQDPENFPMLKVFLTCFQNIGAGTDTTSISLSAIMWNLITNPEPLAKLRAEIDEKTARGELSDPPTMAQTQAMPYFQACIQEGLRIHPAAAFPLVRVVPKGGASVANQFFPEGVKVSVNCWVAHSNKTVFGDDVDKYRPERWLVDADKISTMNRYWIPFGHGSRTCLGKNISLMEISKVVPQLLRKFDFHLDNPDAELECTYVSFVKQKNIFLRITERREGGKPVA